MTLKHLISDRYHSHHTRASGYPVFKTTSYDFINLRNFITDHPKFDCGMVQDSGASSLQFGISGFPISYEAIFFTIGWCKFFPSA
jgi:hypothetical protein